MYYFFFCYFRSKVQAIQSDFDVSIKFPDKDTGGHGSDAGVAVNGFDSNKSRDIIIVRGKKDKCLAAKDALFAMVPIEREITVPFKYHRFIIGQKGEFVRSLMDENDVNIKVWLYNHIKLLMIILNAI